MNKEVGPEINIIIATHKKYQMPEDDMYIPLHVGAEGKKVDFGYQKDDTGDNISKLNASFCELTGLYWAWKNINSDYIGLVHYRRYLGKKKGTDPWKNILVYKEIKPLLGEKLIFVPKKRRYYIETLYSHYKHTHYANHLDCTKEIIKTKYPEYLESYNEVIEHRYGYMFNMFIMKKTLLDDYCTWLFDILFALNEKIDSSGLDEFQGRLYGRVSEILFNVWLEQKLKKKEIQKKQIKEFQCIYTEKISYVKKIEAFLKAKYFGIKYDKSF